MQNKNDDIYCKLFLEVYGHPSSFYVSLLPSPGLHEQTDLLKYVLLHFILPIKPKCDEFAFDICTKHAIKCLWPDGVSGLIIYKPLCPFL